ncbi:glycosyltransferase family 2 protein [uncultured Microscilla sp.]|uniref:glycosyltransferase family 2 protein n=1 Tax=uncultured Microscilla sp. TaxID=432653 RepID=UPI00260777BB|nr:glycosyltransferase family 2 protein [uncultured Microscilla sp.]
MKKYFYRLLAKYLAFYIRSSDEVTEVSPKNKWLLQYLGHPLTHSIAHLPLAQDQPPAKKTAYVVLNGNLHYERDIQAFLIQLQQLCTAQTRVMVCYYNALWRPLTYLATRWGFRNHLPEQNWFSASDLKNFSLLADYEIVSEQQRILCPVYIPLVSYFLNRWLAPLPFFRWFTLVRIAVLRPLQANHWTQPSVSIVVAARNEAGNIENIVKRLPKMGINDELILVEGNSEDDTWEEIKQVQATYKGKINIKIAQQPGKGKGDAIRTGFALATQDILMILDADLTVSPEDLPKFYQAMLHNKGEFINGSRLVYPMENKAMRFFNLLGNKAFAKAFSFLLNQRFKDTLCGTKVISRHNYLRLAQNRNFFGDFDPFGDFDLLFGAARLGLKIVEIPVSYKARTYGKTNIKRWSQGFLLLKMVWFAARKIKFI